MVTGLPARSCPVVMSRACSRNENAPFFCCAETRYMVEEPVSMTGVEVSPCAGLGLPPGCGMAPGCNREVFQSGLPSPKLSASKAYTVAISVATKTTLWQAALILRFEMYNG